MQSPERQQTVIALDFGSRYSRRLYPFRWSIERL